MSCKETGAAFWWVTFSIGTAHEVTKLTTHAIITKTFERFFLDLALDAHLLSDVNDLAAAPHPRH
jgi:hypothetical protein